MSSSNSSAYRPLVSNRARWHRAALPYFAHHSLDKVIKGSGWTIAGQSIHPILIWETIYQAFIFLVNLHRQTFVKIFYRISSYFPNISLYFIQMCNPLISISVLICVLLLILYKIDLTFDLKCSLVSMRKPVKLQSWSTNGIIRSIGTP